MRKATSDRLRWRLHRYMVREGRLAIDPEDSLPRSSSKLGVGAWRPGRRKSVVVQPQAAAVRTEVRVGECFGEIVLLGTTCRQVEPAATSKGVGCSSVAVRRMQAVVCTHSTCKLVMLQVYTVRTQTCCELYSLETADLIQLKSFFPDDYFTVRQKALLRMFRIIVRQIPFCCERAAGASCLGRLRIHVSQDASNDGEISKDELGVFARRCALTLSSWSQLDEVGKVLRT